MKSDFEFLEWDSEFFNLKIGKLSGIKLEDSQDKLKNLFDDCIDLIYYYSDSPLDSSYFSPYYDVLLVDTKIPIKKFVEPKSTHPKISSYSGGKNNNELIALAQLAGGYTRFKIDSKISDKKFNELFKIWMEKSIEGSMASKVLVYTENDKIVGFATAKIENKIGYAPLLAVDRKYEGLGISFALMNAVQSYLFENGCEFLISSTQKINKKALKIYERWGCIFDDPVYVYHLWRKNPDIYLK